MQERGFYSKWIIANGIGEATGLGSTFILGMMLSPYLSREHEISEVLIGFFIAIILGVILEGVVVGYFQGRVISDLIMDFGIREWITATAIGAGVAWFVGMIPSTVMSIFSSGDAGTSKMSAEPPRVIQYALAVVLGLITGPILGFAQALVLRKHLRNSSRWLWANATAWAFGMLLIFIGMDFVPWEDRDVYTALSLVLVTFLAGIGVGAIHGRFLLGMIRTLK